jgi:NhaP-type Na+/H+ or K+/H+ antiporter
VVELAVFGALIVLYGLVSGRLDGTPLTGPIVFVSAGLLVGALDGSVGVALEEAAGQHLETTEAARLVAEVALVLLLFTDAARIDLTVLRSSTSVPLRLLAIGLPLSIVLGGVVALALLSGELDLWEAFVVGSVLAPTDAALGAVVVSSPKLPVRLRQALNVEAGLNDGLSVPFFVVFAVLAAESALGETSFLQVALEKLGYGALIGAGIGLAGGRLLRAAARRGWPDPFAVQLSVAALALLAWWSAEEAGGSGLIAAFVGGMALGGAARGAQERLLGFGEELGQLLSLLVFYALGIVAVDILPEVTWQMVVYGVLSLTVIRMLPVGVALLGVGLRGWTVAYLGWFGPRGLVSVLLGLILLVEYPGIPGGATIFVVTAVTVLLSVYLHGASAAPLTERFARLPHLRDPEAPERAAVADVPLRRAARG